MSGRRETIDDKRQAWRFGRTAETMCVWYLRLIGYHVIARGFRVPVGEIDIIARRGRTLAFVEVKARSGDYAADALSPSQRRRIVRAAEAFLKVRPGLADLDLRLDVMLVRRWRLPRHLRGAWRVDD